MFYDEYYDSVFNGDNEGLYQALSNGHSANVILTQRTLHSSARYQCGCEKTTPLLIAVSCGYVQNLRTLLDCGALVNLLPCPCHDTALHLACMSNYNSSVCLEILLSHGAIVNVPNAIGLTPLHIAVQLSKYELVHLLLNTGADANSRTQLNETPLILAASYPLNLPIIQLLLEHKIDVNASDQFHNTSLQLATKQVCLEAINILLQHGADPNIIDIYHQSPLFSVAKIQKEELPLVPALCLQTLLNHGANIKQICLKQNILQAVAKTCPYNILSIIMIISSYDYVDNALKTLLPLFPRELQYRHTEFSRNLHYLSCNPRSLRHLCRCVIRFNLKHYCHNKIHQLPLPDKLIAYLLLKPEVCQELYL
ncbi:ankyrin repeat and SOCS box protein 18-like [Saccoglossus kowalevskii]|uniref:Ankyrin repeat and SOCS box protein 4-like isoform X1 n=1 Tax=Saccoglossus kowalevskii TaxID=10224 RepID=A0ABM0MI42_SACKO|nr:PREDICTED: ankyrin repeat and SOCS box protein 4-like isoform X1 [Saccoglossus kowalevskii]XP_006819684.1 PREDICTED: ankyrin repeat and SOCS box protein 4-like isoform X2 [Saccoglossus kowalevskii]